MTLSEAWALEMLLAAFAGGAFGAAIGALPAFAFTGFMVIAGEVADLVGRAVVRATGTDPTGLIDIGITSSIAFGPVFGPHISFAGGAAAAAYAANQGYMDTDFDYYEAKNIAFAQGTKPDVLVAGGLFGIVGYWTFVVSSTFSLPWDPIAMGVVISAFAHRIFLGYDIIGDVRGGILDMSPFEQDDRRVIGEPATDGGTQGRLVVEPWLPHQYKWANVTVLGFIVGVLGAYIAYVTGSAFLGFGISAASLLFLATGVANVPVTHHITLPASTAALALAPASLPLEEMTAVTVSNEVSLASALLVGGLFGIIGALAGELIQRVFYAHADTHVDPPAASIVVTTFIIGLLAIAGILPQSVWVPTP